ncbi:cell division protein FtsX [Methylocystis echinoides]|uniref:Cell division protein FtsX n=1 Tax=Methylocystis echinoides TaxID=29468 RepID=A0A9W6GUB4_9HYPH|nr:ABC transporter permease [Methylocystis echinoides]GLI93164.1 cell division protein FtsX [Methylocystis echinoides]
MDFAFASRLLTRLRRARPPTGDAEEDEAGEASPLAPTDSIAGRSVVTVIAIMTFLAALAAAAAILIATASAEWRSEAATEAIVQIRPAQGRDIESDLRIAADILQGTPGVREAQIYSKEESESLLAPWLGQGLDLSQLPVPRMIVVKLDPREKPDLSEIREALAGAVPSATFDDHRIVMARLGDMARAVVSAAALIFLLILGAMGVVVASATRAAVATNREIVDVLHIVGATDSFIAQEFQRRFLALGLRGAIIGAAAAIAFLMAAQALLRRWRTTAGGEQMESLFGDLSIGFAGYAVIVALAAGVALLTGWLSRRIVFRHLRGLG